MEFAMMSMVIIIHSSTAEAAPCDSCASDTNTALEPRGHPLVVSSQSTLAMCHRHQRESVELVVGGLWIAITGQSSETNVSLTHWEI